MKAKDRIKVNIIIPVYNEKGRIEATIQTLAPYLRRQAAYDVVIYIVDDASTDDSGNIALYLLHLLKIDGHLLTYPANQGKGFAVRHGMINSRKAEYYFMADADHSAEWDVLFMFLGLAQEQHIDLVVGSRALALSRVETPWFRKMLGRIGAAIIQYVLHLDVHDTQCGYKLFSRNALCLFQQQTINRWGFDFEILLLARRRQLNILEVAIEWHNQPGSKVGLFDYFKTLIDVIRIGANQGTS